MRFDAFYDDLLFVDTEISSLSYQQSYYLIWRLLLLLLIPDVFHFWDYRFGIKISELAVVEVRNEKLLQHYDDVLLHDYLYTYFITNYDFQEATCFSRWLAFSIFF